MIYRSINGDSRNVFPQKNKNPKEWEKYEGEREKEKK